MVNDSEKFRGKFRTTSHRLKNYDYSSDGAYFITICTKNRQYFFGEIVNDEMVLNELGEIVAKEWQKTGKIRENIVIDEFVVMPNHIHGILWIKNNPNAVETPRWGVSKIFNQNEVPRWGVSSKTFNQNGTPSKNVSKITMCGRNAIFQNKKIFNPKETPHRGVSTGHKHQWKSGCLGAIINQFKSVCSKQIRILFPDFAWQRNYHDRIIRNDDELNRIREYIIYNPQNWEKDDLY